MKNYLFLICWFFPLGMWAQTVLWNKPFGGTYSDTFKGAAAVSDGVVVAGYSSDDSFGNGDWIGSTGHGGTYMTGFVDATVVKFKSDGSVAWKNNFGGHGIDEFHAITAVSDGVVTVGHSWPTTFGTGNWTGVSGRGYIDASIVKFNNSGNMVWRANHGGMSGDWFAGVTTVSDGVVAVGNSSVLNEGDWTGYSTKGDYDASIVKFRNDGTVAWKNNFGGPSINQFFGVTMVADGIVAVGFSNAGSFGLQDWSGITGNGDDDAIIAKFDFNGNLKWKNHFGGSGSDGFYSVTRVADGVIAAGYSASSSFNNGNWTGTGGKGGSDAILVKYDNNGNLKWKKNFGGSAGDRFYAIAALPDGIVAAGESEAGSFNNGDWGTTLGRGNTDGIVVKFNGGNSGNDCNPITNMAVNYTGNCEAQLTWNAPATAPATPSEVVFTEDFEGGGSEWTYWNNGDGDDWEIREGPTGVSPHSGSKCARNLWLPDTKRNAWLFSPGIQLTAGTKYTIKFWLLLPGWPDNDEHDYFELKIGQTNSVSDMNTILYNNTTNYIPNWTLITKEFTPGASDTFYLGFHAFTPRDEGDYILVDDVEVSTNGGSTAVYNIYRDGVLIKGNHNQNSYTDTNFDKPQPHTWGVKTVCAGGVESAAAQVTKNGCSVGIVENEQPFFAIVPNPASAQITITAENIFKTVEIINFLGQTVISQHNTGNKATVNIARLSNGIYFVRIITESSQKVQKFMKY